MKTHFLYISHIIPASFCYSKGPPEVLPTRFKLIELVA